MLAEELQKSGSSRFSFLVSADANAPKDYIGYCLAYLGQSPIEPPQEELVLYATDWVALSDTQIVLAE